MFIQKIKHTKAFVFDIDGVLTDGTVHVTETGEQLRKFNVRDGYAMQYAVKSGYNMCVISGGKSASVVYRFKSLGIENIFLNVRDKARILEEYSIKYGLKKEEILYIGDDIPDIDAMRLAGIAACPADAAEEVKAVSLYISNKNGGMGCVRDVIEKVLKMQGKWYGVNDGEYQESGISSI